MRLGMTPRNVPVAWRDLCAGDVILVEGERLYVREVDRSVLSPNLGALVCPANPYLEDGDDTGSHWLPRGTLFEYA